MSDVAPALYVFCCWQCWLTRDLQWAIEFADEHPSASVLGVDLSPIQPQHVPVNCSFRVDNAEEDWILEEKYDFIHLRAMILAIKNWPRLIQQAFR
jgi:hypothetical protein